MHTLPDTINNFTDLRGCIEKLTRFIQLTHPTRKKGTSIATSAHFSTSDTLKDYIRFTNNNVLFHTPV
ncbi:hypothetical protein BvCmsKSP024_01888 [Escherichia coli]|nr:hypothetical protein BvCmsKSP024_01888 [Escherichia coli]GDJ69574.1 hypothetical protein BvCmsKSP011_00763 [Escherichia coli]